MELQAKMNGGFWEGGEKWKSPQPGGGGLFAERPPVLSGGLTRATLFAVGYGANHIEIGPHI